MTTNLTFSIENLYTTFSSYPLKSTMDGCPCCVAQADKEKIHSTSLRELQEGDLSRYAFKAMTTWGDVDDFKHYLPRIFELMSRDNFIVDSFVLLDRLNYGKWQTWPVNEQEAINTFLFAWWESFIKRKVGFDKETFIAAAKLIDMDRLLHLWRIDFDDRSFYNFVDMVYHYYNDLDGERTEFRGLNELAVEKLLQWIKLNLSILEKGFFHFAESDSSSAEKISITRYIFDHS